MKENEDAVKVFFKVRGQVIRAFNGEYDVAVDLNHLAVWAMIDACEIKDRMRTFDKVVSAWHLLKENEDE